MCPFRRLRGEAKVKARRAKEGNGAKGTLFEPPRGAEGPAAPAAGTAHVDQQANDREGDASTLRGDLGAGTRVTLAGYPPEDREFVHAVYGTFPYALLFVVVITHLLLMRAFRSVLLPLKAVLLDLVSLGAAFGIIVFAPGRVGSANSDRASSCHPPQVHLRRPLRACYRRGMALLDPAR